MRIRRNLIRQAKRIFWKCFMFSYKRSLMIILGLILMIFLVRSKSQDNISNLLAKSRKWYISNNDFFKPTLYLKPIQNKNTGAKFFNRKRENLTYFRLDGFNYCQNLNNSWFKGNVYISKLGGTIMHINPTRQRIIDLIDDTARNISVFLRDRSHNPRLVDLVGENNTLKLDTVVYIFLILLGNY